MGIPFGRFTLLKKLAAGGMGQVFLARTGEDGFEKLVVVKRILPHLVEDEEFFTMFMDEARIAARLNHPNVAQIFDLGNERGVHYIVMEYIAGEDVRRVMKKARGEGLKVPLGIMLRMVADAAAGLDYAHKVKDAQGRPLGLVHRDVSPQNILVGFDGGVKLIDFGVAKAAGRAQHTGTGILKGKFPYMSPEQAEGEALDARSDVFALGIVLWELLTDKRLFKGESDIITQKMVKACKVPQPSAIGGDVPKELDAIVLKALARNVADRYPDALAFRLALEEFMLSRRIPGSSAHVQAFMQQLYAERIAEEGDLARLDVLQPSATDVLDDVAPRGGTPSSRVGYAKEGTVDKAPSSRVAPGGTTLEPSGRGSGSGSGSKLAWVLAGFMGVAAVGAVALWSRGRGEVPPVAVAPVQPAPQVPALPPEPKVGPLALTVESEPSGASIDLAGTRMGTTPMDLKLERGALPAQLKVSYEGYEPREATITGSSEAVLKLQLKKRAAAKPKPNPDLGIKTGR